MTQHAVLGQRIIVVGASRGLGRAVALALAGEGARVLAVSRSADALGSLRTEADLEVRAGDATDPSFVANLLADEDPDGIVLVAGARPVMRPLHRYSWEAFSANWNTDVKAAFFWLQEALGREWSRPGRVVVFSSGAALHGSRLSGGYAGAKQTQRFMCKYAADEARERGLPLTIQCILPQLNPNTALGAGGVRAYAARAGEEVEAFVAKRFGEPLRPEIAGRSLVRLLSEDALRSTAEFLLKGSGLEPLKG